MEYKNAFKSVNFEIDPTLLERRSLVKKLEAIDKRKSISTNFTNHLQISRQKSI